MVADIFTLSTGGRFIKFLTHFQVPFLCPCAFIAVKFYWINFINNYDFKILRLLKIGMFTILHMVDYSIVFLHLLSKYTIKQFK